MIRTAIFPLNADVELLLRYSYLLAEHEISGVISYREDELALQALKRETGLPCSWVGEDILEGVDALLLLDNHGGHPTDKYHSLIRLAESRGVEIIAGRHLWRELAPGQPQEAGVTVLGAQELGGGGRPDRLLKDVHTPVVGVLGYGGYTGKFECQLLLWLAFRDKGYDTAVLASNDLGVLFGMEVYPDFMFSDALSLPRKTVQFNRHVHALCEVRQPDALILGVPGGLMSLSEDNHNDFGELAMVAANALDIDTSVFCLYHMTKIDRAFPATARKVVGNRLNIPVDGLFMSRQKAKYDSVLKRTSYLFLEEELIDSVTEFTREYPVAYPTQPGLWRGALGHVVSVLERNAATL